MTRLASSLKTLEETVEMARLTGLPLRTIANQAQMVRTENLMLKVCAWHMHGACMAHAWRMHGACMAHAWYMVHREPDAP